MRIRLSTRAFWVWIIPSLLCTCLIAYEAIWLLTHNSLSQLAFSAGSLIIGHLLFVIVPTAVLYFAIRFMDSPKWRSRIFIELGVVALVALGFVIAPWAKTALTPTTYWQQELSVRIGQDEVSAATPYVCITSYRNQGAGTDFGTVLVGGWKSIDAFPAVQMVELPGDRVVVSLNLCPPAYPNIRGEILFPPFAHDNISVLIDASNPKFECQIGLRDDAELKRAFKPVAKSELVRQQAIAAAAYIYAKTPFGATGRDFPVKRQKAEYFGSLAPEDRYTKVGGLSCSKAIANPELFSGHYFPARLASDFEKAITDGVH